MATPNCFKLIVHNNTMKNESSFVTYLPIHSTETCEIRLDSLNTVYKDMLQSCGGNWMQLWSLLESLASKHSHHDYALQNMHLIIILKDLLNICRWQK
jgi:hypothetical protein